jgi:hypothetical protein
MYSYFHYTGQLFSTLLHLQWTALGGLFLAIGTHMQLSLIRIRGLFLAIATHMRLSLIVSDPPPGLHLHNLLQHTSIAENLALEGDVGWVFWSVFLHYHYYLDPVGLHFTPARKEACLECHLPKMELCMVCTSLCMVGAVWVTVTCWTIIPL